ncbi:MAG: tyrosine-type recombinase/integrase [Luteimonas sp.]
MKRSLSPTAVKAAKPKGAQYKLTDGGGLYLLVTSTGQKLWRYKFRLGGKELTYAIGRYPDLSLAKAREDHENARRLVAQGSSPVLDRKIKRQEELTASANSFEAVARQWQAEKSPHWSSYYAKQVQVTLERDVFPRVGKFRLKDVTASHLRPILKEVAARTQPPDGKRKREKGATTVATLIRQWCSAIFRHGIANGVADSDPAYALRDLITRPKVRHHRHLTAQEIPDFLVSLRQFTGTIEVKIAMEMLLLTFVRTGELRNAEWKEIDVENARWRIPASKMKMGREHIVPLMPRTLELIGELRSLTGNGSYLFPNQRTNGEVMSMTTINRALERMGYGGRVSGHGFRGTAATFLNEAGWPAHIVEKQLAHDKRSAVEASYNHAAYLSERTKMMSFWSNFIGSGAINVVAINKFEKAA